MKIRKTSAAIAALAAAALTLSACQQGGTTASPTDTGTSTGTDTGSATGGEVSGGSNVTVMWNQPLYSLNSNTDEGNATANNNILYLINDAFNFYNDSLKVEKNTDFGSYEVLSEDPLTVKYTVNENTTWSDGTPVGAADMILFWGALNDQFENVEPEFDDDGKVTNQEAVDAGVYFSGSSPAMAQIPNVPEVGDDGRSVTITYEKPRSDWEVSFGVGVPAHVVAMHALDITDPAEAQQAVIDAFTNNDTATLNKLSVFWNTGFNFDSMPDDKSILTSNGAFQITDFVEGQYVTLSARPDYAGANKPKVDTITVRYNEDPLAAVTALQNGEANIMQPQATADTLAALQALTGVTIENKPNATFEHVDVVFNNGGPFDPATYGGNEETAHAVRLAFLTCIPRQEILDKLIKPLDPEATLRESYVYEQDHPNYETVVGMNGLNATFGTGDPAAAKAILDGAGVDTTTPIAVRFLYAGTNERRIQEYQLISASCSQAGFDVQDNGDTAWGPRLPNTSTYDASLFGWQSTSTFALNSQSNFVTGGQNNYGGMSNAQVDEIWSELETNTDQSQEGQLIGQMEKILVDQAFGTVIFQHPGVTAWTDNVSGVSSISLAPTVFWDFWNWEMSGSETVQ